MNILTTSNSAQNLNITVRENLTGNDVIYLYNESTKEVSYVDIISYSASSYYTIVNAIFNLEENTSYIFKIQNGGSLDTLQAEDFTNILTENNEVIELENAFNVSNIKYYGRIFCTNQTNYSINNNTYIDKSSNNDFIFL
tara:strand:+ start:87 stop:506 length:420 start_codon:yes stop_codon:yes gene_type:complete